MPKRLALLLSIAALLLTTSLTSCATSNGVDPKLDKALADYHNWRTITTTITEKRYTTEIRSDGPYRNLLTVFQNVTSPNDYPQLVNWFTTNRAYIPAPLYWEMATLALKSHKDNETIMTWLMIGQITALYDKYRCKDSTSGGAYQELLILNPEVGHLAGVDKPSFFKGTENAISQLKKQSYNASPMWICSHGMSSFEFDKQAKPVTYNDLVFPTSQQPRTLTQIIGISEALKNKHKKTDLPQLNQNSK